MILAAEGHGFAEWPGSREIPKYQILTTKQILEEGKKPIIPENYRIGAQTGVGKAVASGQDGLFDG